MAAAMVSMIESHALVSADADGAFRWLHSLEDASLALPVTNPWRFFDAREVELSDADTARVGSESRTSG